MFSSLKLISNTIFKSRSVISLYKRNISLHKIRFSNQIKNKETGFSKRVQSNADFVKHSNCDVLKKTQKLVGVWLLSCGGMVFIAVGLGGVTRLTESGLSMVTWNLIGERPPTTENDWKLEFERYKQFPEFKMKNSDMTIDQFKKIYWMEFAHRMWGRAIGVVFAVPAIYFWTKGYFTQKMKVKVVLLGALIGLQGLMGWYMVQSGLEDRFSQPSDVPRVSQYRLASHLSCAFILYTLFLWNGLHYLLPAESFTLVTKKAKSFRRFAHITKGAVFLTALSGAFVAGLDAGLVYNSFPKMADRWIPSDLLAFSPVIRNFTENPTTVQFDHRVLGTTTLSLITALWILSRRRTLPRRAYKAVNALALMGWIQVALGISTLLSHVPVHLAAAHQSGSVILLSFAVWLTHELKLMKYIPK